MSSDTAYPTLTSWAKTTLTYLFEADPHNFDDSIVKYLAKDVEFVVINGKQLTKEEYVTRLHASRGTFKTAKVEFLHAVEVQDQEGSEKVRKIYDCPHEYCSSLLIGWSGERILHRSHR